MKTAIKMVVIIALVILSNFEIKAQVDVANHNYTTGFYVGWNTAQNLNFKIGTGPTQYMTILGTGSPGYVGIGTTFTPSYKFDVDQGDINLNQTPTTGKEGYRIDGERVLWHNNDNSNIFVGVDAGIDASNSGTQNTFLGYKAGFKNTTGDHNTYIGNIAGGLSTTGDMNTAMGWSSGEDNVDGNGNTSVGYDAGDDNEHGDYNVCIGNEAGNNFITPNTSGNSNTFIGYYTRPSTYNLTNACAIGANAQVAISNAMVLGSEVNVGIGTSVPSAKLEVSNASVAIGSLVRTSTTGLAYNIGTRDGAEGANLINIGAIGQSPLLTTFPSIATFFATTGVHVNAGVIGWGEGSTCNFGGIFEANNTTGVMNIGVYASASASSLWGHTYAGFFQGNIFCVGNPIDISDNTFKDSVQAITGALNIISRLHPKNFVFKTSTYSHMGLPSGHQLGFIAQQVDTVLPILVSKVMQPQIRDTSGTLVQDTMTIKGLDYTGFIPLAIRAIQELDTVNQTHTTSTTTKADSNHVVKWGTNDRVLKNSLIYDDGNHIGIPVTVGGSYVNVFAHSDSIVANFQSDLSSASEVVKASYSTNGNTRQVAAVRGYSKYVNAGSDDDGVGGRFEGGFSGVYSVASGANDVEAGVIGVAKNAGTENIGLLGLATQSTSAVNAAVQADGEGSSTMNVGTYGTSDFSTGSADNMGIYGVAYGSSATNTGGRFEVDDANGVNYAVYAQATGSAPDAYAGYFNGDVNVVGAFTNPSDLKLKNNVQELSADNALSSILRLEPKTYEYRKADYPYMSFPAGSQTGFIAQDVQQVLPQLVSDIVQPERKNIKGETLSPRLDYKALNYTGIIPLLVGAVKKQQTTIDSLSNVINNRLNAMEERLSECCHAGGAGKTDGSEGGGNTNSAYHMSVELSSMQVIVLEQNAPNPFADQTSISYFVPESMGIAQIIFTDMLGTVIKTADVKTGYGVMTVFASNLSTGQYSYTLVVDGKQIETKKMVKSK